jgi:hypothetical protein
MLHATRPSSLTSRARKAADRRDWLFGTPVIKAKEVFRFGHEHAVRGNAIKATPLAASHEAQRAELTMSVIFTDAGLSEFRLVRR